MAQILYNAVIAPLVLILEFFYELIFEVTDNAGLAVLGLSVVVTLVTLPLYMIAERYSEIERKTQERFKPQVQRIKDTFKGDEQYMMVNAFYRENRYHPMMALRSSISLLIQVPFFLAAYNFLSTLETLHGYSFAFIKDFALPDSLFSIGSFNVNILPILMTLINIVAGAIYSKGHAKGEKIQIYALALVFLVVLYDSPAGLVVYWTMNNVLSLAKNVFYKLKNPRKVLYILLCAFSLLCLASPFTILSSANWSVKAGLVLLALVLPLVPFALVRIGKFFETHFSALDKNETLLNSIFFVSAFAIAILSGFVIPSILVDSEPANYCFVNPHSSPFVFIWTAFFQAAGLFVLWPGAFYLLFTNRVKKIFAFLFAALAFCAIVNTFAFGGKYGPIEPTLLFMEPQDFKPSALSAVVNALIMLLIFTSVVFLLEKFPAILRTASSVAAFALIVLSVKNGISIQSAYSKMEKPAVSASLSPVLSLSSEAKNVVFIMLDKCYSPYLPYIFDDLPALREKFDGFTFFPNTVSLGVRTMVGTPGLYGGYDYTPYQANKRTNETLQQKHNEALLSLPVLFGENGFKVQTTALPYENFLEYPTGKMYEPYPFIERLDVYGPYADYWYEHNSMEKSDMEAARIKRNFIAFGIFKMVPPILRDLVYHNEYWTAFDEYDKTENFIKQYSALDYLPELTKIEPSGEGTFFIFDNECTHEAIKLQAPNFVPAKEVSQDSLNENFLNNTAYSATCGVFLRLAEFFDYLKENGAYDNTRIIIVSDHGKDDDSILSERVNVYDEMPYDCSDYVATLLVKDFGAHGKIKSDTTFMTNADCPAIATRGLIPNAKNPFTGNPLEVADKREFVILHAGPAQSTRIRNDTKYAEGGGWFTVKDDISRRENWGRYEEN